MGKISQKMSFLRKQESRQHFYLILFSLSLLLSFSLNIDAYAEEAGPGWFMGKAEPVSPEEAEAYYNSQQTMTAPLEAMSLSAASATTATNEIIELARALRYDPKLIYDYVHNHIDYVPYFGSLKGATLTYLDRSGNDFDQASLMIALLRESSNYNTSIGVVQFVYGQLNIPYADLANWIGVDNNNTIIGTVIASGGIPITLYPTYAQVNRVWIKANINGSDYLFDPAFKSYQYTGKIDIGGATGYNQSELLSAASIGATIGSNYVQNINETNISNKLETYSTSLANTIRSQYPNSDIKEIIGGRSIVQSNLNEYSTTLPFSPAVTATWDEIPQDKTATLRIQHVGIDYTLNIFDLSGKRFTLTYAGSNYHPELRMDGTLIASGTATTVGSKNNFVIKIDHPYAANSGTYMDQTSTYTPESGRSYAIVYNFGGISDALIQKRQKQLDSYVAQGLPDGSEAVLGETLNIMGLTWLKEVQMEDRLLTALAETVSTTHHMVGLMAQEAGYYIDVKTSFSSITSKHNIEADRQSHFKTLALIGSAFEHGMLEQLMGSDKPAVSTMKLFKIANATARKIFLTDSANYASVKPQLQNYTSSDLTNFQNLVNSGYALILPDNGQLILNSWKGQGYIAKQFSGTSMSMQMAIGGGYFGGYNSTTGNVNTTVVNQNTIINGTNNFTSDTIGKQVSIETPITCHPIDMASGAEVYENADIALGGNAPMGLAFSRFYDSNMNLTRKMLGYTIMIST